MEALEEFVPVLGFQVEPDPVECGNRSGREIQKIQKRCEPPHCTLVLSKVLTQVLAISLGELVDSLANDDS